VQHWRFEPARPRLSSASAQSGLKPRPKKSCATKNKYSVKLHQSKVYDEFDTTLPVWNMQRRHRVAWIVCDYYV